MSSQLLTAVPMDFGKGIQVTVVTFGQAVAQFTQIFLHRVPTGHAPHHLPVDRQFPLRKKLPEIPDGFLIRLFGNIRLSEGIIPAQMAAVQQD